MIKILTYLLDKEPKLTFSEKIMIIFIDEFFKPFIFIDELYYNGKSITFEHLPNGYIEFYVAGKLDKTLKQSRAIVKYLLETMLKTETSILGGNIF